MKKILLFTALVHLLISLWACRFLEEMIHTKVPEVENCSLETDHTLLQFTTPMNWNLTEQAFSLTEEDSELEGRFIWDGNKMSFYPHRGIMENRNYTLNLENSAEDGYGNSLGENRSWKFYTGEDNTPPLIQSVNPVDKSEISNLRQSVSYDFSETVDHMSFREALEVSPALEYHLEWTEGNTSVQVQPLEDYSEGEDYTFTVSTRLKDLAQNNLKQKHELHYLISSNDELLLESIILESSSAELEENGITEYVEKDDILNGRLNRRIYSDEIYGLIRIQPDVSFSLDWDIEYREFTLSFDEDLRYGESYDLYILDRLYTIQCTGSHSIPLSIESIFFCSQDGAAPQKQLVLNESLGAYDSDTATLEFILNHSPYGVISESSFMKAFSIESSVLSFRLLSLELEAAPPATQSLIRICLDVSDTGFPGTVRFSLDDSLSDSLGNSLEENWTMMVNQP
ncbi:MULTISPECIES: Ig-like domain-containing protein [unclassified Oceanispirochaeta]|uniref:Ig-like domain-containing protein n=1 Tax=unclassified Oceanispirochaeta TaxID=2635722 RepID=UPI000E094DD9|nr:MULTISPECIES: Ig-like domain-containing protein [unclassified Oceanispirochaeta]MBF9017298.1 Ig-like domain-containing protein [Oceanispirochaeta sp. M2]NPD73808.1 Ig-like domain-containing protein [Oceanispirochaeta sp. M1]RDG30410.1 hypothetical protein DV872_17070 [Oceanispirochaeta sp. M1]